MIFQSCVVEVRECHSPRLRGCPCFATLPARREGRSLLRGGAPFRFTCAVGSHAKSQGHQGGPCAGLFETQRHRDHRGKLSVFSPGPIHPSILHPSLRLRASRITESSRSTTESGGWQTSPPLGGPATLREARLPTAPCVELLLPFVPSGRGQPEMCITPVPHSAWPSPLHPI